LPEDVKRSSGDAIEPMSAEALLRAAMEAQANARGACTASAGAARDGAATSKEEASAIAGILDKSFQ